MVATLAAAVPVYPDGAARPGHRTHWAPPGRGAAPHRRGLLTTGDWDHAALRLSVDDVRWEGVGAGHGLLRGRQVSVPATGRGAAGRPSAYGALRTTASSTSYASMPSSPSEHVTERRTALLLVVDKWSPRGGHWLRARIGPRTDHRRQRHARVRARKHLYPTGQPLREHAGRMNVFTDIAAIRHPMPGPVNEPDDG